jgi:hypothetical protein
MKSAFLCLAFVAIGGPAWAAEPEDELVEVRVPSVESGAFALPKRTEIQRIEAELYNCPEFVGRLPAVNRFIVPPRHYDSILEFFANPAIDREPRIHWPEIGAIIIFDVRGKVFHVPFYWRTAKGPLSYSVHGVRLQDTQHGRTTDDALTLDLRIRDAYRTLTGHITIEPLPR